MDRTLWQKTAAFDLDDQPGQYTFSVRLMHENSWTRSFTTDAILEYRKFMFLEATSGKMVSPSETVDTIWHLHLLFSESYQEFCNLLGKQIQCIS